MIIRHPLARLVSGWADLVQGWEFDSWQNMLATALMLLLTVFIAVKKERTPFEVMAPSVDKKIFQTNTKL